MAIRETTGINAHDQSEKFEKLFSRIEKIVGEIREDGISNIESMTEDLMEAEKSSDKYILDALRDVDPSATTQELKTFLQTILEQVNRNRKTLSTTITTESTSSKNKALKDLIDKATTIANRSLEENKNEGPSPDIKLSFENSSGEVRNMMETHFTINSKGQLEAKSGNGAEAALIEAGENIADALEQERIDIENELKDIAVQMKAARNAVGGPDTKKIEDLNTRREKVEGRQVNHSEALKVMASKKDVLSDKTISKVNKTINISSKAAEKAIETERKAAMTAYARFSQGATKMGDVMDVAGRHVGDFTESLAAAGDKMMQQNLGPMGKVFGDITMAFSKGLGPLAVFAAALGAATVAIKGYHEKMDISRSMGDNSGSMVEQLRNMHLTTLMPPEELKKLSDSVEGKFGVSLSSNQKEMANIATKQRLTDRIMGKEYAESQMAALNDMKGALTSDSVSGQMSELQNSTTALAKTMGVSNKYALEQIKAIHANTKEIGKTLDKGSKAALEKQFQQLEAGLRAAGFDEDDIAAMRDVQKEAFTADGAQKMLQKNMQVGSMDPAILDKWAKSSGLQSGDQAREALQDLAIAGGDINKAAIIMAQKNPGMDPKEAHKLLTGAVQATELAFQEGAQKASNDRDLGRVTFYGQAGQIDASRGEKASKADAASNMIKGRETAAARQTGEAQTNDLNAILLSMGAKDPESKRAAMDKLVSSASKEDQDKIKEKMSWLSRKTPEELKKLKEKNPEAYAKEQEDAYKVVMGDRIKQSVETGDASSLGTGIDAKKAQEIRKSDDFSTEEGKLVSTTTELAGDKLQQMAIASQNALEKTMMAAVNTAMPALTNALDWLSNNITLLIPILAALTAAFLLYKGSQIVKGGLSMMGTAKDFIFGGKKDVVDVPSKGITGYLKDYFAKTSTLGDKVVSGAKAGGSTLGSGVKVVGEGVGKVASGAKDLAGKGIDAAKSVDFKSLTKSLGTFAETAKTGTSSLGTTISTTVKSGLGNLGSFVKTSGPMLGEGLKTGLSGLGSVVTKAGSGLLSGLGGAASGLLKFVGPIGLAVTAFQGVTGAVEGWGKATEYFGKESVSFSEKFSSAIGGAVESITFGLLDGAKTAQWVEGTFGGVWTGMKTAWDGTMAFLSRQWESFKNIFAPVIEAGKKVIDDITNVFVSPFKAVWSLFTGDITGFMTSITDMFTSYANLFTSIPQLWSEAMNAVWVWISELGQNIAYKFTDMFTDLTSWWEEFSIKDAIVTPIIEKITSGWNSITEWWEAFPLFDTIFKPISDGISNAISSMFDSIINFIASLPGGETILSGFNIGKDRITKAKDNVAKKEQTEKDEVAKKENDAKVTLLKEGKTGKALFDQMAGNGMAEKNWTKKDEVGKSSLGSLSDVQLKSLQGLTNISEESKKAIEAELKARQDGTKVQEKVTDAAGKTVTANKTSIASLSASGVLVDSAEKGKKSIKDTKEFESMTKEQLGEFLKENGGSLDKATNEKLRSMRDSAKSTAESSQLTRAEEIKKQAPPVASAETKQKAQEFGKKVLDGVDTAKTKVAEVLPEQAKKALGVGQDGKVTNLKPSTENPSDKIAKEHTARINAGEKTKIEGDEAEKLMRKTMAMSQLAPATLEKFAASSGAGSSADMVKTISHLKLAGGNVDNATNLMMQEDPKLTKEDALVKLTKTLNALHLAEKESLKVAKENGDYASQEVFESVGMSETQPLSSSEGPKDTNNILYGILKAIQDLMSKGSAVVTGTVTAGKESIEAGKKAYDESRASGKGVIESAGTGVAVAGKTFAGKIGTMNEAQSKAYADSVAKTESGGKINAENKFGYIGKYQTGAEALAETGMVDKEKLAAAKKASGKDWYKGGQTAFLNDKSNWKIEGGKDTYMKDEALQDKVFADYTNKNFATARKTGLISDSDDAATQAGKLKAAHLLGVGGAKNMDKTDANGTTGRKYYDQAYAAVAAAGKGPTSPVTGSPQGPAPAVKGAITGATPTSVATAGGIDMYAQTQAAIDKGIKYGFGNKDLKNGSIDCSGWVACINKAMMDSVVDEMGNPVYGKEAKKLFDGPAADIIKNVTDATGKSFEGAEDIKKNLKPGMIIGEDNGEKGWDKGRYKGIDHITQVVQDPKTGQMMISESQGGKGVTMRTAEEYFAAKDKKGTKLTGVDPTLLAKGTPAGQSVPSATGTQVATATKDVAKTPAVSASAATAKTNVATPVTNATQSNTPEYDPRKETKEETIARLSKQKEAYLKQAEQYKSLGQGAAADNMLAMADKAGSSLAYLNGDVTAVPTASVTQAKSTVSVPVTAAKSIVGEKINSINSSSGAVDSGDNLDVRKKAIEIGTRRRDLALKQAESFRASGNTVEADRLQGIADRTTKELDKLKTDKTPGGSTAGGSTITSDKKLSTDITKATKSVETNTSFATGDENAPLTSKLKINPPSIIDQTKKGGMAVSAKELEGSSFEKIKEEKLTRRKELIELSEKMRKANRLDDMADVDNQLRELDDELYETGGANKDKIENVTSESPADKAKTDLNSFMDNAVKAAGTVDVKTTTDNLLKTPGGVSSPDGKTISSGFFGNVEKSPIIGGLDSMITQATQTASGLPQTPAELIGPPSSLATKPASTLDDKISEIKEKLKTAPPEQAKLLKSKLSTYEKAKEQISKIPTETTTSTEDEFVGPPRSLMSDGKSPIIGGLDSMITQATQAASGLPQGPSELFGSPKLDELTGPPNTKQMDTNDAAIEYAASLQQTEEPTKKSLFGNVEKSPIIGGLDSMITQATQAASGLPQGPSELFGSPKLDELTGPPNTKQMDTNDAAIEYAASLQQTEEPTKKSLFGTIFDNVSATGESIIKNAGGILSGIPSPVDALMNMGNSAKTQIFGSGVDNKPEDSPFTSIGNMLGGGMSLYGSGVTLKNNAEKVTSGGNVISQLNAIPAATDAVKNIASTTTSMFTDKDSEKPATQNLMSGVGSIASGLLGGVGSIASGITGSAMGMVSPAMSMVQSAGASIGSLFSPSSPQASTVPPSIPGTSGSVPSVASSIPSGYAGNTVNTITTNNNNTTSNKTPDSPATKVETLLSQILTENIKQSQYLGISSSESKNQTAQSKKDYKAAVDRSDVARNQSIANTNNMTLN